MPVTVRNTGRATLVLRFTWLGVQADHVTGLQLLELGPGETRQFAHLVALPAGMPPSCRQLALQVQDQNLARRVFPCAMAVGAADDVRLWVQRSEGGSQSRSRSRSRFALHVANRSDRAVQVGLEARSDAPVGVGLHQREVAVAAGGEVVVPGWVRTPRTSRTGRYLVELRAVGAGAVATTSFGCQAPPLFPVAGRKVLTLAGVVTVWAALLAGGLALTGRLGANNEPTNGPPEQLARDRTLSPAQSVSTRMSTLTTTTLAPSTGQNQRGQRWATIWGGSAFTGGASTTGSRISGSGSGSGASTASQRQHVTAAMGFGSAQDGQLWTDRPRWPATPGRRRSAASDVRPAPASSTVA